MDELRACRLTIGLRRWAGDGPRRRYAVRLALKDLELAVSGAALLAAAALGHGPVTLVEGGDRILARDHPLTSTAVADQLTEEGLDLRVGASAKRVRAAARIAAFVSDELRIFVTPAIVCQHALTPSGCRVYGHVNRR